LIIGAGVLPPNVLSSLTSMLTTCMTRSAKLSCAGVGLNPNLSSGIAFTIPANPCLLNSQSP
jgi:hypothetical protein